MKTSSRSPAPSAARRFRPSLLAAALLLAAGTVIIPAQAAPRPVQSLGVMRFVDGNTLVVSDWRAGLLHVVQPPAVAAGDAPAFNLKNIFAQVARALHVRQDQLRLEDMAVRPGSEAAYISLSVDTARNQRTGGATASRPEPALVSVNSSGKVTVINLRRHVTDSVEIGNRPTADKTFWRDTPQATLTVTDMVFHDGKLYVAGLSNASFASTLRVYDFPFSGQAQSTSVEMYHPVHNQVETRAPIRRMAIATLSGVPTLVAAFTCSPLVTIPLGELRDGAHIAAKTIAEFGWGSMPMAMVTFDAGQGPMLLLTHSHKSGDLLPMSAIEAADRQPGLNTPITWPAQPLLGVKSTYTPISGVARLDNQDATFFLALRRDEASGAMQLVSVRKGYFLRLSDFVNEYDFDDYRYPPNDGWSGVHRTLRTDEGFGDLTVHLPK